MNRQQAVVIGAGKLGCQIANDLSKSGANVTVLDMKKEAFERLNEFSGFTKVGDGTNASILRELGLTENSTLVLTTQEDNVNLFIADVAQLLFGVQDIYGRLADKNKTKLITSESIHPICPFLLSISYFHSLREKGYQPDESGRGRR